MKKDLYYLFLIASIVFGCLKGVAQTSRMHILDLNPRTEMDSTVLDINKQVRMGIVFKMDDASQADSVFFLFGKTPQDPLLNNEKGRVTIEKGQVIKSGDDYFVTIQGGRYIIKNTEVSCGVIIPRQLFDSSAYLSMVAKDKKGLKTNLLHIRIN